MVNVNEYDTEIIGFLGPKGLFPLLNPYKQPEKELFFLFVFILSINGLLWTIYTHIISRK